MFAGPNGSGKSTLKTVLPPKLLGVFLNPDEIEDEIRRKGFLDFALYGASTVSEEVLPFFTDSAFLTQAGHAGAAQRLVFANGRLDFRAVEVDSYFASVTADFIRQKLLERKVTFTFETVMSHRSKVNVLARAQAAGYRTYLYFVATDDPSINISRVRNRVRLGGHAVPEDRIAPRYHRSLDLLADAIRNTNRAYIFDNSGDNADCRHTWLAEIAGSALAEFDEELASLSEDLCVPFNHAASRLEAELLTIYKVVVQLVRREEDLDKIAAWWSTMASECDEFAKRLQELSLAHPNCGAGFYYDRVLDLRNKCQRLSQMHS
jgi:predicted ABC-type ATPase